MTKQFFKANFSLVIFSLLLVSLNIAPQNSIGNLPPQIINQLKTMTPKQQQDFADKYNIQLPLNTYQDTGETKLGEKGEPIEKFSANENFFDSSQDDIPLQVDAENKIQRFGLSFFDQEISTFAPVDDVSVPDNYILGVGDSMVIQMMGTANERYNLEIARDGTIFIESLGVISVAGLSMKQAVEMIEQRVVNELFGSTVSINLGKLKAMNIFLAGEIKNPGMYSVSSLTSVTQALYQAGGITELGSIRNIQVLRSGEKINTFDAYDLLIKGDSTNDIRLKSGDVVLIPPYQAIAEVKGESRRPMLYEISPGETVADLIAMSSGFAENASLSDSVLLTKPSAGLPLKALTLDLLNQDDLKTPIGMDDTLIISKANISPRNYIEISGASHRTGLMGWQEGMKLSDVITDVNKDFPQYVDLDFSMIARKPNPFSDFTFLRFSLRDFFQNNMHQDLELYEYDQILFFSSTPNEIESTEDALNIDREISFELDDANITSDTEDLDNSSIDETDLTRNKELSEESKEFTRAKLLLPFIELIKLNTSLQNPMKLVSISGAVPYPGIYPLFEDATPKDLINAAGGLTDLAYADAIELRRQTLDYLTYSTELIELNASNDNLEMVSTKLKPLDHLTVRKYSSQEQINKITLSGEFIFPGEYVIGQGESIVSVIERAGGFTKNAFIDGSIYLKKDVKLSEIKRLKEYSDQIKRNYSASSLTQESMSSLDVGQFESILSMLESVEPTGRVAIDLSADNLEEFVVSDGDSLHIPIKTSSITVVGEVNVNNSLEYREEYTIDDYLRLSGGLTKRADEDSLYIVKANGSTIVLDKSSFRIFGRRPDIGPGDTIVVPVNIQYKDSLQNWTEITQLIYQSMVSIAAVKGL